MCHHVGGRKGGGGCAGLENGLGMGESEERTGERESSVHPDFYGFLCFIGLYNYKLKFRSAAKLRHKHLQFAFVGVYLVGISISRPSPPRDKILILPSKLLVGMEPCKERRTPEEARSLGCEGKGKLTRLYDTPSGFLVEIDG